jgi:hypothetical protein
MTNKDIIKEFIWLLIATGLSSVLTISLMPLTHDTMFGNMFNIDGLIADLAFKMRTLIGFLILFPILFLLTSIREATKRLNRRPQNIYLLFICFISISSSLVCLVYLKPFATILFGSWTIYPPLSALPHDFEPPANFDIYYYCLLSFIAIQLIVTIVTCRQVFKKLEVTH